jgi:hypothetical protein
MHDTAQLLQTSQTIMLTCLTESLPKNSFPSLPFLGFGHRLSNGRRGLKSSRFDFLIFNISYSDSYFSCFDAFTMDKSKAHSATTSFRMVWDRAGLCVKNLCKDTGIYVQIYERSKSLRLDETHFKVSVNVLSGGVEAEYGRNKEYHVESDSKCAVLGYGDVAGCGLALDDDRRKCTFPLDEGVKLYILIIRYADDRHFLRTLSCQHKTFRVKDKHFGDKGDSNFVPIVIPTDIVRCCAGSSAYNLESLYQVI